VSKNHHETPTSRSDTIKRLDEILLNTLEVLEILKSIKNESKCR
jgi:hypothetical protein